MSPNVPGGEIDQRSFVRGDRFAIQMPGDVLAEFAGRAITMKRLLAQSLQHDVVQITLQTRAQAFRFAFARFAELRWRMCDLIPAVAAGALDRPTDDHAGQRRFFLADHPRDFMWRPVLDSIGAMSSEQFVKYDAERIDVAGCRNVLSARLFRAGVFRSHRLCSCL